MSLPYPQIDPVAIHLGPLPIRWYSLAYIAGLAGGWFYLTRLLRNQNLWKATGGPPLTRPQLDDVIFWVAIGVMLGGRMGYLFFYEPSLLIEPWEPLGAGMEPGLVKTLIGWLPIPPALMLWRGGMSFHGGLIGVTLAGWLFARSNKLNALSMGDLFACATPIGLFFGRIANFINGELYGRPTTMPWGMVFPEARLHYPQIEPTPRHPSQLYEAAMEGLILFIVLRILTHYFGALKRPGLVSGAFLVGYAIARSLAEEFFRQPHFGHAFNVGPLTVGTVYSIPMLIGGLILIYYARSRILK